MLLVDDGGYRSAVACASFRPNNYGRLFEPPLLPNGLPNPRHLSNAAYLALARQAARRGAERNGLPAASVAVGFPGVGFAPTRVSVQVRGKGDVARGWRRPGRPVEVGARATAELAPDVSGLGMPTQASGGGYDGPLAHRQGKPKSHFSESTTKWSAARSLRNVDWILGALIELIPESPSWQRLR